MAGSDQQLSGDEFHRMQLQILDLRTENYQLKDENKKLRRDYTQSSENEAKLEKEVGTVMILQLIAQLVCLRLYVDSLIVSFVFILYILS